MYVYVCMCVPCMYESPLEAKDSIGYPGAGVKGGSEPLYMGAGNSGPLEELQILNFSSPANVFLASALQ